VFFVSTHLTDQKKQSSKNKLHNEDLRNLCAMPGMIRVIKEGGMGGVYSTRQVDDRSIRYEAGKSEVKSMGKTCA
jgi:hypothetical protein